MQAIENQESQGAGQNSDQEDDRPLFVKSTNFRNSQKMDPKNYNEPPTDRQIRLLQKLQFAGEIPSTRKAASDAITELLKVQPEKEDPNQAPAMRVICKNCGVNVHKYNAIGEYCCKPACRAANPELKKDVDQ